MHRDIQRLRSQSRGAVSDALVWVALGLLGLASVLLLAAVIATAWMEQAHALTPQPAVAAYQGVELAASGSKRDYSPEEVGNRLEKLLRRVIQRIINVYCSILKGAGFQCG